MLPHCLKLILKYLQFLPSTCQLTLVVRTRANSAMMATATQAMAAMANATWKVDSYVWQEALHNLTGR